MQSRKDTVPPGSSTWLGTLRGHTTRDMTAAGIQEVSLGMTFRFLRIVCLADVYDALTSRRVYKEAFCHETSREIILNGSGTHFDPDVVKAFLQREAAFVDTCKLLQTSEASLLSEVTEIAEC